MHTRDLSLAFKCFVDITAHRDHEKLDAAALASFCTISPLVDVTAYKLTYLRDQTVVQRQVWLSQGTPVLRAGMIVPDGVSAPISTFPIVFKLQETGDAHYQYEESGMHHLWLPIWANDQMTSCIQLVAQEPFSEDEIHTLVSLTLVYRNYQNILDYSERDSLTGLLNRKTFDARFSRMLAEGTTYVALPPEQCAERRSDTQVKDQWLAVVDIDHFKRVNDTFGHLYGDEVLILVANFMRSSLRPSDAIFRFGGEEFVVLLRSATSDDATHVFQRLRTSVEKHDFPQVGQVTVSIGFVRVTTTSTPVIVLGQADQALYHAKTHGRNQVCQYDDLVARGLLEVQKPDNDVEFF